MAEQVKKYWLSRIDAAASCGVALRTFDYWGVEPVGRVGQSHMFDIKSILENRLAHQRGDFVTDEKGTMTKAKADLNLTLEKTRQQKFKNDVEEGKYIPIDILEILCAGLSSRIGAVLDSLPLIIKRSYPDLPVEVIEELDKHFRKCQNAISNLDEQVDEILDEYELDEPE